MTSPLTRAARATAAGLLLGLSAASANAQPPATRPATAQAVTDNPELAAIFQADQAARQGQMARDVGERDAERRRRVEGIIAAGQMRTAADHFHAAMVFQHGGSPDDYMRAHELAKRAAELDPSHRSAKWLSAAAMDRYLLSVGRPQVYGTQFMVVQDVWVLQEIDESAVTDEQRAALGVPPLAQARERARKGNAERTLEPDDNRAIDALFVALVTEQRSRVQPPPEAGPSPRLREISAEARRIVAAGEARTVRDLYESAAMIEATAAGVEDRQLVLALIERARGLAPDDPRLHLPYARAVDALRTAEGKGQWYGTAAVAPEAAKSGRWEMPDIDPDSPVTDEERKRLGVPLAAEWQEMVGRMNRQLDETRRSESAATRPVP